METQKQLWAGFDLLRLTHERISNWSAQILGPLVFNFGTKEKAWNLTTADFLRFPEGTLGKALGESLREARLEPIAHAESHDVYHVLFDYSTTLKDEVGLQFFLLGNGKTSIAAIGVSIGAWFIFPLQWNYLKRSYKQGKKCSDISKLDLKALLHKDLDKIKISLFEKS
ncbi:MAG: Coq4 family protein [Bacteroidota bacterium]